MDKEFKVTFRIPEKFRTQVKQILDDNAGLGDTGLMSLFFEAYFNPPAPQIQIVEKEVIKEVLIDSEGTVQGHSVSLSDALWDELTKIKYNRDTSMDAFVGDILWNRIHWSQNKKSPVATQVNSTSQKPAAENNGNTGGEAKFGMFEEYRRRKREDCFSNEDWAALKKEVENDPNLTVKQKRVIIEYN